MPSTGIPSSSSSVRSLGAPSAYTDAGPPERIRPRGERRLISSMSTVCGRSSLKTPHSRTRRAISCEYCPPKSRTSTSSERIAPAPAAGGRGVVRASATRALLPDERRRGHAAAVVGDRLGHRSSRGRAAGTHADRLVALELLALRLERRRDHDLRAVERGNVLVAAGGHRRAERPHQVEGAVVLVRGAEQDLLECPVLRRLHARAARERRVERGHAPVEPAARRLVGASQRRADHHGVATAGEGLRDVAAVAHAAIGDDVDVLARLEHVLRAGGRHVGDRGCLRNPDAEHAPGGAGGARADAHEHAHGARAHEVQARRVRGTAAHDDRDRHLADELLEVEWLRVLGHVLRRDHGALDHEDVETGLERGLVVLRHALRCERGGTYDALVLDLADALRDELLLDRSLVDALHLERRLLLREVRDALELVVGVLVATPDALEVQDSQSAGLADDARHLRRDDAVHRRRKQRQLEAVRTEGPRDVDVVGVPSTTGRDYRDVVEAVCATALLATTDLNFHGGNLTFGGGRESDLSSAFRASPRAENP